VSNTIAADLRTLFGRSWKADQPGAAAIVVRNGKTLLREASGLANLELGVPLMPDSVFRIASITKQFTAAGILLLQARGKLDVGDRITKYLRRYPTRGRAITIDHLLRHTSGIQSYTDMPSFWANSQTYTPLRERIDFFKDQPMQFAPGERFAYNNSGYVLLGAIIERVSGLDYATFMRREIFDKLGMRDTRYDSPESLVARRVMGYQMRDGVLGNADYLSMEWPYSAGALLSTVDDLARWDAALYTGKLLSQRVLQQAWTPSRLNDGEVVHYGMGWALGLHAGLTCIEHSGGINGFQSFAIRIPERRVFVAVLANAMPARVDPMPLALRLAALAAGAPIVPPRRRKLPRARLLDFCGRFVSDANALNAVDVSVADGALQITDPVANAHKTFAPIAPDVFASDELGLLRARFTSVDGGIVLTLTDRDRVVLTAKRAG
jgi:D-alanyl-D-alanine carboxypeptidase